MADKLILVDTWILIDYYRKIEKENSVWITLVRQGYAFAISAVTKYEIYSGATSNQLIFWDSIFKAIIILPFDELAVDTAVALNSTLKKKRKQINIADLFIAATAVSNKVPLATLKHFERIDTLNLVE